MFFAHAMLGDVEAAWLIINIAVALAPVIAPLLIPQGLSVGWHIFRSKAINIGSQKHLRCRMGTTCLSESSFYSINVLVIKDFKVFGCHFVFGLIFTFVYFILPV